MLRSSPLSSRGQFGQLLTDRKLNGLAVEIGTHRGEFAEALLRTWPDGKMLYCIDPWSCPLGYEEQTQFLWGGAAEGKPRTEDMEEARRCLRSYKGRYSLLQRLSMDAVKEFTEHSLDFVFVDGDHRYEHVLADLNHWWAKIKPGGILAGHDFVQPGESHSWAGEVQKAVLQFAWRHGQVDVQIIVEEHGLPWSYYMEKP